MPLPTKEDELGSYAPDTWVFWRNMAVYFCVFSVAGHWLEIVYCSFMNLFGIVDADSLVWDDPLYPFLIYGIGTAVCAIVLVPLKERLIIKRKTMVSAGIQFFVITILVCMTMELAMGFLLNQPNMAGEYPLWDNSDLPFNVLDQAWLVNDIALGALAMLYTWILYPLSEKAVSSVKPRIMNAISLLIVVGFIILCVVKFS